ncbi:MAG: NAD(+) diphosphatase [Proteobacteria bacterium]|nr:NAD(+) diphosphatase [Pseudomonadota bacterium]
MMELFNKKTEFIFKHNVDAKKQSNDLLFIFENNEVYIFRNNVPAINDLVKNNIQCDIDNLLCFGTINSQQCFCLKNNLPASNILLDKVLLKTSYSILSEASYQAAVLANHLSHWLMTHKYCGACKGDNNVCVNELALQCANCNLRIYPIISPCVIGLIYKGNEILLAQAKQSLNNIYGCISGFVNPGENLEAALAREVYEEVGLNIHNIKYVTSQHWPFPNSLMIGFTAEYLSGDINVDTVEISDAAWYDIDSPDKLPNLPSGISVSRHLINEFCTRYAK